MAAAILHILSARRKALGQSNATGTDSVSYWQFAGTASKWGYCCSLSNLGSSGGGVQSLGYQRLMLSQVLVQLPSP